MADPSREPETGDATAVVPERGSPPRVPGWVKWPGIIVGVLVLAFLVLRFFGLQHGPGQHGPGRDAPPANGRPGIHAPAGGHG